MNHQEELELLIVQIEDTARKVQEHEGKKALIFGKYQQLLDRCEEILNKVRENKYKE